MGDPFPLFALSSLAKRVGRSVGRGVPGKDRAWLLLLYWPTDFGGAEVRLPDEPAFVSSDLQVFGVASTRAKNASLPFTVLADGRGDLARMLGLRETGIRASYLVDPEGVIRWVSLESLTSPRPFEEAFRALANVPHPGLRGVSRPLECMCAWCRQVQTGEGRWQSVESFIETRLSVEFSHGICPECLAQESGRARPREGDPRRSERVLLRMRVSLETEGGVLAAHTTVVNRHGALVISPVPFAVRTSLRIATLHSDEPVPCRVVWYGGQEAPGLHRVGLELLDDRPDLWGPEYEASLAGS